MATGDINDVLSRLTSLLPPWFGDTTQALNLNAILNAYANLGSNLYTQYAFSKQQTRIQTATNNFLDLISADYFGNNLPRGPGESDAAFSGRILKNLLSEKATRRGVYRAVKNLTGRNPVLFEPRRPADTGGYSVGGAGYGVAGGWGSLQIPYNGFVTAYRPIAPGTPGVTGYGNFAGGYSTPSYFAYTSLNQVANPVPDSLIYSTIDAAKAAGTVVWVRILS